MTLSPSEPTVHPAAPPHAAGIAAVHVRSWLVTYEEILGAAHVRSVSLSGRAALWRRRLERPERDELALVAVAGGVVVGFAWVGPTTDADDAARRVGQIRSIHVDPDHQGGGVGRALLRSAKESLAATGFRHASLWVVAENTAARRFYERDGWQADGSTRLEPLAAPGEEGPRVLVSRYRTSLATRSDAGSADG